MNRHFALIVLFFLIVAMAISLVVATRSPAAGTSILVGAAALGGICCRVDWRRQARRWNNART